MSRLSSPKSANAPSVDPTATTPTEATEAAPVATVETAPSEAAPVEGTPPEAAPAQPKAKKVKAPPVESLRVERKVEKPRKPSGLDAAAQVLKEAGTPLSCQTIVETMLAKGLWTTNGKTPAATIYSAMLREIDGKPGESRFVKAGRGTFALATPASRLSSPKSGATA